MAQDKDKLFEKIYFMWKGEGEKRNQSIDFYCERYDANVKSSAYCMTASARRLREPLTVIQTFWNQLFLYRCDGEYTIDNLVAERTIRKMTIQRKNSLFFYSDKGARKSTIYNTFISTCRQVGVSFRDYFRKLMKELGAGRSD